MTPERIKAAKKEVLFARYERARAIIRIRVMDCSQYVKNCDVDTLDAAEAAIRAAGYAVPELTDDEIDNAVYALRSELYD